MNSEPKMWQLLTSFPKYGNFGQNSYLKKKKEAPFVQFHM
jgi:hypothetical protein